LHAAEEEEKRLAGLSTIGRFLASGGDVRKARPRALLAPIVPRVSYEQSGFQGWGATMREPADDVAAKEEKRFEEDARELER
jgi:hypothetical protein